MSLFSFGKNCQTVFQRWLCMHSTRILSMFFLWLFTISVPFVARCLFQVRSDQLLSHVRLFATPWIAACQASLPITNSQSSLRLMSIESVMPSSHLILCHPLLLLSPNPSQHESLFQWGNSSHEVPKVLEFQSLPIINGFVCSRVLGIIWVQILYLICIF